MSILTDLYKANQLSLNVNKTVLMKFWPNKKPFSIKLGDTELISTNCTKFLGVTVDNCLKWKEHVSHVHNKVISNRRLLLNAIIYYHQILCVKFTLVTFTVILCTV